MAKKKYFDIDSISTDSKVSDAFLEDSSFDGMVAAPTTIESLDETGLEKNNEIETLDNIETL